MVDGIKFIQGTDIKSRESKSAIRNADSRKGKPIGDPSDLLSKGNGLVSFRNGTASVDSQIISSNEIAAQFDIADYEDAEQALKHVTELIRQNHDLAESAQANIPSNIVLNLFENMG